MTEDAAPEAEDEEEIVREDEAEEPGEAEVPEGEAVDAPSEVGSVFSGAGIAAIVAAAALVIAAAGIAATRKKKK